MNTGTKKQSKAVKPGKVTHKLPPDPEHQNDDRANWAEVAIIAFEGITGSDRDTALPDLLGDLMHWCDRNNESFEDALDRARRYYREETA